jgi:hypothetical protein
MPINQSLWRLTDTAEKLPVAQLNSEKQLEDFIVERPDMLDPNWMLIGRQVPTDFKGIVDLLALQPDGTPVIIELKRARTPRDVLAQTLDYASWLEELEPSRLQKIYESFSPGADLEKDFQARFGTPLDEEALGNDHLMVIVAAELDTSTERIVKFLSKRDININVLFFQVFQGNGELLLSRSWFVDPSETQVAVSVGEKSVQWNGEFYTSFREGHAQSWEDARKYGFITASGGVWYTRTLNMLNPGDRVWVSIPGKGYVGVGRVTGTSRPIEEFTVTVDGVETPVSSAPAVASYELAPGDESRAWFVPVEWIHTIGSQDAFREVGFFGKSHTVAKPKNERWLNTIESLKKKFGVK